MLTVRHVENYHSQAGNNAGTTGVAQVVINHELILEAERVWVDPNTAPKTVAIAGPDKEVVYFSTGTLFVMNSDGKTIAKYDFD